MKLQLTVAPSGKELVWGLVYLGIDLLVLPLALAYLNLLLPVPLSDGRLNGIYFLINFAAATLIFRRFLLTALRHLLANWKLILGTTVLGFFLYWAASIAVSMVILAVDPEFSNVNDSNIAVMAAEDFDIIALCTIVLVPITEELLFRGTLFGGLYNRSRWLAFTASCLLFCCVHVVGYVFLYPWDTLLLCFIQYLPAGLVFGWAYARCGNLLAPVFIHTIINAIGIFAMR